LNWRLALLVPSLAAGCFPIQYTLNAGASGTVVDARDKSPIAGANVHLDIADYGNAKRRAFATTNDSGEFFFRSDQEWGIYVVLMDPRPIDGLVTVDAIGYKETRRWFRTSTMGPANSKLGVIVLERNQ